MSEYVNRCFLEVNGQTIEDFKSVAEKEVELHKAVNLMNKTGVCGVTPRYGVTVDYVVPAGEPEFDWEAVKDGTLTIEYEGGRRRSFTGVYVGKIGEAKTDGDNELVKSIELLATGRA